MFLGLALRKLAGGDRYGERLGGGGDRRRARESRRLRGARLWCGR